MKVGSRDPYSSSKLFTQPKFKKAMKNETPTLNEDDIFDMKFQPGKPVAMGKPKKKSTKDKLATSFNPRSQAGNYSTYYYERF